MAELDRHVPASRPARIPPNFFGMALGLSGLSALWIYASASFGAPAAIGDGIALVAAAVWAVLTVAYFRQGPRQLVADVRDATVGPFLAAWVLSAFLLTTALVPHAPAAARAIVVVFLVLGVLLGGWLTGQWLTGGLKEETFTAAFFLPGLGTGFVGSDAASAAGLHTLAQMYFGIGTIAWVLMSSVVLNRIFFRPRLAPALLPTMAIELAPAAVAGTAYFAMHPGPPNALLFGLAGYAALMVVAQLPLLPLYRALSFTPSFWSFTFPTAAMGTFALEWLAVESPAGKAAYAWIVVVAITALVGAIATRTVVALARGQLLPRATEAVRQPRGSASARPGSGRRSSPRTALDPPR